MARSINFNLLGLSILSVLSSLITDSLQSNAKYTVVHLTEICRHGARTSTFDVLNLPLTKELGMGSLTGNGQRQHYLLGQTLRLKYPSIFSSYNPAQVDIYCSSNTRTIHSAICQSMGLWPLGLGENITVAEGSPHLHPPFDGDYALSTLGQHSLPHGYRPISYSVKNPELDFLFSPELDKVCPNANDIYHRHAREVVQKFDAYVREVGNRLEEKGLHAQTIFNHPTFTFTDIAILYDEFRSYRHYYGKDYLDDEDLVERVNRLGALQLAVKFSDMKLTRMGADGNARVIIDTLGAVVNGTSQKKFLFFSGHDSTLFVQMLLFNMTDFDCLQDWALFKPVKRECPTPPSYASTILYELLKDDNSQYYVRSLLNGVAFSVCEGKDICPWEEFKRIFQDKLFYTDPDKLEYCGNDMLIEAPRVTRRDSTGVVMLAIFFGVVTAVLLGIYFWMRSNENKLKAKFNPGESLYRSVGQQL